MVIRGTVLRIWLGLLKLSLPPAAAAVVAVPSSSLRSRSRSERLPGTFSSACEGIRDGDQERTCCSLRARIAARVGAGLR